MPEIDVLALRCLQESLRHPDIVGLLVAQGARGKRVTRRPGLDPRIEAGLALLLAGSLDRSERGNVAVLAEVEAQPDLAAHLRLKIGQQRLERGPGHPGGFGIGPDAEMQPQNAVQLPRNGPGLCHHLSEIFLRDGYTQQRVRLDPAAGVSERVVALVERADVAERRVVQHFAQIGRIGQRIDVAGRDLHRVLVLFPGHRIAVGARVGDHEQQRFAAELEAAFQHLDDRAVRQLVDLVGQHEIGSRPRAGLAGIARHRPKERPRTVVRDVEFAPRTARELQPPRQCRRLADHLHRVGKENAGLFTLGGRRINLGAGFTGSGHPEQTNPTRDRRFAVAFALFDVSAAKPAAAVGAFPAEQAADDEGLARLQPERLAFELAFGKLQHLLEEPEGVVCSLEIEPDPVGALEVVEVSATGIAHVRPGNDLAGNNRASIVGRPVS